MGLGNPHPGGGARHVGGRRCAHREDSPQVLGAGTLARTVIRLTQHAETELPRRRLRREWIEAAVAAPDWTTPDPDPSLTRSYRVIVEFGGRVLRVVHRRDGDDVLVVTAHFDRGARR